MTLVTEDIDIGIDINIDIAIDRRQADTAKWVHWKVGGNCIQKRTVMYTEAPRHLRHLPTRLLGIIYKFVYTI